jgi:hypothetical protein
VDDLDHVIGVALSDGERQALDAWYTDLRRALDALPAAELHDVEPPLRSTAGPTAA